MGMASSKSSPLPCGTPSMMSMRTTSASSLEAIQWAAVAPTFPEPTIVTFFRMKRVLSRNSKVFTTEDTGSHRVKLSDLPCEPLCPLWLKLLSCLSENCRAHILDNAIRELAGLHLGRAFHQPLEVIRNCLLKNRPLHPALDQIRGLVPSQEAEHHYS